MIKILKMREMREMREMLSKKFILLLGIGVLCSLFLISQKSFSCYSVRTFGNVSVNVQVFNWTGPSLNNNFTVSSWVTTGGKEPLTQGNKANSPMTSPAQSGPIASGQSWLLQPSQLLDLDRPSDVNFYVCEPFSGGEKAETASYGVWFFVNDPTASTASFFTYQNIDMTLDLDEDGDDNPLITISAIKNWLMSTSDCVSDTASCGPYVTTAYLPGWVMGTSFLSQGTTFPSSFIQPMNSTGAAAHLLWPPANVPASNFVLELGDFYGVINFNEGIRDYNAEYRSFYTNQYAVLCENVSGVNNNCVWFGSQPVLPPLS